MTYALGIELTAAAVRLGRADRSGGEQVTFAVPPVLMIDGDRVLIGSDAEAAAAGDAHRLASDLVGQFTADRLFLVGGRMLSTDDALRELLAGLVRQATVGWQAAPTAVTVSCPALWDAATRERVARLGSAIHLPLLEVVSSMDVGSATSNAAMRLPAVGGIGPEVRPDLPSLDPTASSGGAPVRPTTLEAPIVVEARRSRWGVVASVVVVVSLVGGLAAWLALRSPDGDPASAAPTTTSPDLVTPTSVDPPRSLTIGVVDASADASFTAAVATALDAVNGAGGTDAGEVFLVSLPAGSDPAATARQVVSQGARFVVTDVTGPGRAGLLSALADDHVAVCGPSSDSGSATGVVVDASADVCVTLAALAAISGRSIEPGVVSVAAVDLTSGTGLPCEAFGACADVALGGQIARYRPQGQPLTLLSGR